MCTERRSVKRGIYFAEASFPAPGSATPSSSAAAPSRAGSEIDRTGDVVYECTTRVVKTIMLLSNGVKESRVDDYVELVKCVGLELRALLATVDKLVPTIPTWHRRNVEMAHKVLSKDMANLVQAMKLAHQYYKTALDGEYRKAMLASAHALAVDAKNLLDTVDVVRIPIQGSRAASFERGHKSETSTPRSSTPTSFRCKRFFAQI